MINFIFASVWLGSVVCNKHIKELKAKRDQIADKSFDFKGIDQFGKAKLNRKH